MPCLIAPDLEVDTPPTRQPREMRLVGVGAVRENGEHFARTRHVLGAVTIWCRHHTVPSLYVCETLNPRLPKRGGKNMGYSFIKCDDATAAEAVISTLNGGVYGSTRRWSAYVLVFRTSWGEAPPVSVPAFSWGPCLHFGIVFFFLPKPLPLSFFSLPSSRVSYPRDFFDVKPSGASRRAINN